MIEDIIFLIAAYLAAVGATIAGFGSSTILIPVALLFMDLKTAVFLVACFHLFNNVFKVKAFYSQIDRNIVIRFGIPSIVCAFIGASLIAVMPEEITRRLLAVFLIILAVISLMHAELKIKQTAFTHILGGGISGLLAGLMGVGGAVRSAFLISYRLPKEVYVASAAAIAMVVDLTRIPTYLAHRIVEDTSSYILLPFLIVCAYFGVQTGKKLLHRIDQELFRKIVLIAILAVGIKLLF